MDGHLKAFLGVCFSAQRVVFVQLSASGTSIEENKEKGRKNKGKQRKIKRKEGGSRYLTPCMYAHTSSSSSSSKDPDSYGQENPQ